MDALNAHANANATQGYVAAALLTAAPAAAAAHPLAVGTAAAAAAVYIAACQLLRFRHARAVAARFRDRAALAAMTTTEAQAILNDIQQREFPYTYNLALQFGIFKTYGVPSVSRLLVATRALTDPDAAAKRYEDTVMVFAEFSSHPPTADRCLRAIARMNRLHRPYVAAGQIRNDDLLYTLSACVAEPIRFIARYEWRALTDAERCALGVFWMALGDAMQIDYAAAGLPGAAAAAAAAATGTAPATTAAACDARPWRDGLDFVDDITAWGHAYEVRAMRPDPCNVPLARRLVAMLLHLVPAALVPFAVEALTVLMGDRMREAFAYPEPGLAAGVVAYAALAARRFVLRHLALPRLARARRTAPQPDAATGRLHSNEYLVHPWYVQPTWWNRWGPAALVLRALGGTVPGAPRTATGAAAGKRSGPATFLPDGFLVDDLGPLHTMGVGSAEVAQEVERLRGARTTGCPFH